MQPETNISPLRHVPDSSLSAPLAHNTGLAPPRHIFPLCQLLVVCLHSLEPTILLHLQYLNNIMIKCPFTSCSPKPSPTV